MKKPFYLFLLICFLFNVSACSPLTDTLQDSQPNDVQNDGISLMDFVGTTNNEIYENKFISLGFNLPDENWIFADTETKELLKETGEEYFNIDSDIFENTAVINVLSAGSVSGEYAGSSTNIKAGKMSSTLNNASIEEIADYLYQQLVDSFASSEIPISFSNLKTTTTELASKKYDAITYEMVINDTTLYVTVIIIKESTYMFSITISSDSQEYVDVIKDSYYDLKID